MSGAKAQKNDRRVFINRDAMEKIKVPTPGSVVLVQRHDQIRGTNEAQAGGEDEAESLSAIEEEDGVEDITVGIAFPMNKIEPHGMDMKA
jgi:hypothetical protein